MDELNNYVVIGLENYNAMRDELAVSRSMLARFNQESREKEELINQLSNQIVLLQDTIADDSDEKLVDRAG